MIIKKYSCNDCKHKEVCLYQENMIKMWENFKRQNICNSDIIFNHKELLLSPVAFFSLECKYFRKD